MVAHFVFYIINLSVCEYALVTWEKLFCLASQFESLQMTAVIQVQQRERSAARPFYLVPTFNSKSVKQGISVAGARRPLALL